MITVENGLMWEHLGNRSKGWHYNAATGDWELDTVWVDGTLTWFVARSHC